MKKKSYEKTKRSMEPDMQSVSRLTLSQRMRKAGVGICILLLACPLLMAESQDESGVLRSRVYKLQHITSLQAQEMFTALHIGKSYNTLTPDVLILTSNVGSDLIKATEIIGILDRSPAPMIRVLMTARDDQPLPDPGIVFADLDDSITTGTLTEAPPKEAEKPAIVDVLGNELIAVAAEDILDQIQQAVEKYQMQNQPPAPEQPLELEALSRQVKEILKGESSEQSLPAETAAPVTEVEPNLPGLPQEPNEMPDSVLQKSPEPETPAEVLLQPIQETPLQEIALQFTEAQPTADVNVPAGQPAAETAAQLPEVQPIIDANESVAEPAAEAVLLVTESNEIPETPTQEALEEDFLSEGLLETLADSETQPAEPTISVQAEPEQTADIKSGEQAAVPQPVEEPEKAPVEESLEQQTEPNDPMKLMQALLAKARVEEQAIAVQEEPETAVGEAQPEPEPALQTAQPEQAEIPEEQTGPIQTVPQPEEAPADTDSELARLRQKITELEAKTTSEVIIPEPEESKIQTAQAAQTEPQLAPQLAEKELETVVDLPQEVELESLVDLVGKQLGLNYMYDPAILRGQKVQLKLHGGKIKVKDMYALLESVLRFKGFIMTRRDQLVTILRQQDMAKAEPVLRDPTEPIQPGDIVVSSLFELKNVDLNTAQNTLKGMNLGTTFTPIAETNTLIVTDFAYRMEQIRQVLNLLDVPGEKKEYQFRTLEYMKPSVMVPKLQELTKQLEGVSLQISASAPAEEPAPQTRTVTTRDPRTGQTVTRQVPVTRTTPAAAQPQEKVAPDAVFMDTDDRTNRILMAGKADQLVLVNELIDALDVPQYDLKIVREYIIENVEAIEVVNVINELGLASVSVSAESAEATSSRTAAARARAARTPTPTPTQTPSVAAGEPDQPSISIRSATNSLLVNATEEQHKAIELVIAHVDVVQKDQRTIRQYEIQYVDTQEIIDTLIDLGIISSESASTQTSRDRTSRTGRQTPTRSAQAQPAGAAGEEVAVPVSLPTAEGGSEKEITAQQPQISVLETTNSLLVYATPRQHDAIALVIAHADRQLDATTTPYVVYALENQNPVELEQVLTNLIQETVEEVGKTSTPESKIQTQPGTTPGQMGTAALLEEKKIKIIPDEKSYSLIVYANKRNQQWISDLIKQLDEYRPQVLLDLTLVEISKLDQFQYDLDMIASNPDFDYVSGTLNYGIGVQETPPTASTILDNLNNATDRNYFLEGTVKSGEFAGFYGTEEIMALLQTMQKKNYGRILNRPKLLVNDNEEGSISLEQVTYREIVTTTIVGSDNPQTSENVNYQDYSAGITMTIKPHISKGDQLRLEITLNRSDFNIQEGDDPSLPPNTITSDVTTVVTVPDKNTIILGGLERINQSKGGTKVPILGDIPLIGGLFRSIGNSNDQRKTYIFVQANILRPGQDNLDLKNISQRDRAQFEGMEKEMQEYQDWPGIDPKPMDPITVLQEDDFEIESVQ